MLASHATSLILRSCLPCLPPRFKGVYDIRKAVDAAAQRRVLHPLVLGAVATTLGAAASLQGQLQQQGGDPGAAPALRDLAAGIADALPWLRQAIEQCIQVRPSAGRWDEREHSAVGDRRQRHCSRCC